MTGEGTDGRSVGGTDRDLCSFRLSINHGRPNWPRQPLLSLSLFPEKSHRQAGRRFFFLAKWGGSFQCSPPPPRKPRCGGVWLPIVPSLPHPEIVSFPPSVHALPTLSPDSLLPPPFPTAHTYYVSPPVLVLSPNSLFSLSPSLTRLDDIRAF